MRAPDRSRPSDTANIPTAVVDVLLWRAAYDVAAAHQPRPDRRCANLQCAQQPPGPCPPARAARHARLVALGLPRRIPGAALRALHAAPDLLPATLSVDQRAATRVALPVPSRRGDGARRTPRKQPPRSGADYPP